MGRTLVPQSFFDDGVVRELCDDLGVKIEHAYALWCVLNVLFTITTFYISIM